MQERGKKINIFNNNKINRQRKQRSTTTTTTTTTKKMIASAGAHGCRDPHAMSCASKIAHNRNVTEKCLNEPTRQPASKRVKERRERESARLNDRFHRPCPIVSTIKHALDYRDKRIL